VSAEQKHNKYKKTANIIKKKKPRQYFIKVIDVLDGKRLYFV